MKTKSKKQIPLKPLLVIIKERKYRRKEMQQRVFDFNEELARKINRHNILVQELGEVQAKINDLRHLIEMYKVSDESDTFKIWELEKACGLTTKNYGDWKFEFEKTKDGFKFKT